MQPRLKPAVYLLSNNHNTVVYTGVTHNLLQRIGQHKEKLIPGFTKRYNIEKLVYYEFFEDIRDAIAREKQLKSWPRKKKNELIESMNPGWKDLFNDLVR